MHLNITDKTTPSVSQVLNQLSPLSWPLVRIITGLMLMPHGAQKLFGWFGGGGLSGTGQFFATNLGMNPGLFWAAVAGSVEFFGGLLLVLGLFTRPAALLAAILLFTALIVVHIPQGFFWTNGGVEYPLMWALLAVAIFLRGGGTCSLDSRFGLRI